MAEILPLPIAKREKLISVIMVSFMTGPALIEAINAVMADQDIFELILVDNGNTPDARKRLSDIVARYERIRLLQGHGNIGFGRACNYGAKLATGDYLLFLNPDALIAEGAARKLANCGKNLSGPWITGGLLKNVNGQEQRGGRRGALTPLSALVSFTPLHRLPFFQSIHRETDPLPSDPKAYPTISGACMMMDRASFEALGGFDEDYFLHVEDIDICRRTREIGGQVYFVPEASAMHYGSTSQVRRQKVEWEKLKGFTRYFLKHSKSVFGRIMTYAAWPFMALAIMGRAWYLAMRSAFIGR
ncbi:glycosyltransferase family 2 protein [Hellea balneolensis]|uniref:glycosyltransferase family 2 protein n=1 Tax=Hellea balneolensis TaxID=287478 RepID=UPI00040F2530|nr:glycosyltransferase family 2 protein [Hellea balneolensis]